MADFYQAGAVTTLHRLNPDGLERLEGELEKLAEETSIALALPALYSEFETPAMLHIRKALAKVRYLRQIVVALGGAGRSQYEQARSFFRDFPGSVTILWVDGERIQRLLRLLEAQGLPSAPDGKGRSCWLASGYLLGTGDCDVIALHDCDVVNYDRQLLARLCYPVANPRMGFEFAKGYYARVTDRMHGRVTRLFMTPLLRALEGLAPQAELLRFLDSFRYPLAGECAMSARLARVNRIPGDWGLEIGVLAEVFRNCAGARVCQVNLADNYEHKHQGLSAADPAKGLHRMAADVAKSLFRALAAEGVVLGRDHFLTLPVRYLRLAEEIIDRHCADALLNGLEFDRHAEELAAATFAQALGRAARDFCKHPLGQPQLPSWDRVVSAVPDFFDLLRDTVEQDTRLVRACAA